MYLLDYWHPVFFCHHLKDKPVSINLCGHQIVLFRTRQQQFGALENCCIHRGMRLSNGWIDGEHLVCPYHGWNYDCIGNVSSPGNPKLTAKITTYEVMEHYGILWIKKSSSHAEFPKIDKKDDEQHICTLAHRIDAPLAIVLDNFSEVEHTASVHTFLGYGQEQLSSLTLQIQVNEEVISVQNKGLQRQLPWLIERVLNIRTGDWFCDNWITYFTPVHIIYDQFWISQTSKEPRSIKFRIAIFFNPINDAETQVWTFLFLRGVTTIFPVTLLIKPLITYLVDYEIKQDCKLLKNLARKNSSLNGLTLGRFDRVLLENRKYLSRIYLGES